jgi:hypothetical protein
MTDDSTARIAASLVERLLQRLERAEAENARLRAALEGLVGASTREELEQLEVVMRLLPAPAEDKAKSIDAIHALLATISAQEEPEADREAKWRRTFQHQSHVCRFVSGCCVDCGSPVHAQEEPRYCTCAANGIELPTAHAKDCRMSKPAREEPR